MFLRGVMLFPLVKERRLLYNYLLLLCTFMWKIIFDLVIALSEGGGNVVYCDGYDCGCEMDRGVKSKDWFERDIGQ